uniref:Uncharacterized protein n=1 Tax=Populus trichocarpa TaxID=3694 RepID=A0A3N7FMK2_POPTR
MLSRRCQINQTTAFKYKILRRDLYLACTHQP